MAQSGSRPPRNSGNRAPRGQRSTASDGTSGNGGASANDRAREKMAQQSTSGGKSKSAAQRARAGTPSGKGGARRPAEKRSTAATAGIFGGIFVVLAVVVILVISLTSSTTTPKSQQTFYATQPAPTSLTGPITSVPTATFNAVGAGAGAASPTFLNVLKSQPLIKTNGKPTMFYVGAEYCPYCAATRWALVVALSRFGTFTGLQQTKSSAYDVYPSTNTLSFYKSTFSSPYLAFNTTEETTNECAVAITNGQCTQYVPLETPTKAVQALVNKFDNPPYVSSNQANGIPFVYLSNFVQAGTAYLPSVIAGQTWSQIAAAIQNPGTTVGKTILGTANIYSAAICKMTGGKPGSVCTSSGVKAAEAVLPK